MLQQLWHAGIGRVHRRVGAQVGALFEEGVGLSRRAQSILEQAQKRIDVLLGPVHATPALPHFGSKDFALAGSPSMVWNVVQFPAGVVPVTRVRADEARRDAPKDGLEKKAAAVDAGSVGLPVGVQVVSRPWQDELVLAAMIGVEERIRGREGTPVTPVEVA